VDLEGLSGIKPVARLLGSPEDEVVQLVKDGKLGGAMVIALGQRGVSVTPSVKNSVASMVRTLEAEYCGLAPSGIEPDSAQATATIMFTDIVGSTPSMIRLGDRRARAVFRIHDEIIRQQTAAYGGQEVKATGDGFMITFRSARSGVACAVAVQRELDRYNNEHQDTPVAVRIGLSVGEPLREDQDLFGSSVARAARISAAAVGGQVLVCQIVQALVAGTGDFDLREAGEFELKGISGMHTLSEVIWRQ
jgi:class 3 adenylate cyclase